MSHADALPEGTPPEGALPDLREIQESHERIRSRVHRTPTLRSRTLAQRTGAAEVRMKCENLQRSGSFKIRGGINASLQLQESGTLSDAGVLTYSSGNHGQAVALSAQEIGTTATIVVPEDIPKVKETAILGYGARVEHCGLTSADRFARAQEITAETGALIIPPFDHPHIIAGQGTVGVEILEDFDGVDTILVPIGGGGLASGVALAVQALRPDVDVIGVEPVSADAMRRSIEAAEVTRLTEVPQTIADGLKPVEPGPLTFAACRAHLRDVLLVEDEAIREAQRTLLARAKLLVEPSGAATVAALLAHRERFEGKSVAVVLSGGNTELCPELLA